MFQHYPMGDARNIEPLIEADLREQCAGREEKDTTQFSADQPGQVMGGKCDCAAAATAAARLCTLFLAVKDEHATILVLGGNVNIFILQ